MTHNFIDKKGNEIPFNKFCTKGIEDIRDEFLAFDQDLEKFSCWGKISELRLLSNVIKHRDGWSATQLKQLKPDFFKSDFADYDLLDIKHPSFKAFDNTKLKKGVE